MTQPTQKQLDELQRADDALGREITARNIKHIVVRLANAINNPQDGEENSSIFGYNTIAERDAIVNAVRTMTDVPFEVRENIKLGIRNASDLVWGDLLNEKDA